MDDVELERLMTDLESERSERTTSMNDTDKFGEAICAFANDLSNSGKPGYLFVGVDDDGAPSGRPITDQLLQNLAAIRSDGNLQPAPRVSVAKRSLRGRDVAVVEVFPSDLPPVRYKGRVWVRVGPRRARASEADERALSERRAALARTWDARPSPTAEIGDLVLALFEAYKLDAIAKDVLDENRRTVEDQLASLRFLDRRSNRPTNAGVLAFGKAPGSFVPGAWLQYVHYEGTSEATEVLLERRIVGDLLTVLRELQILADEIASPTLLTSGSLSETTVFEYPPVALRETFVNAIIHRDYESNTPARITRFSDRLEILNPGGLYGDIRREDFPGATAYRNPVLAETAWVLGFVNRFGRGVPRTNEAMARNGSPPAVFDPRERHFLVRLPRRS